MAKKFEKPKSAKSSPFDSDNIPVVTIPRKLSKSYGNIFLITAILIAEMIGAYTIVALNYPAIYEWAYGYPPSLGVTYSIENITINPAESKGQRFLVCSISIQMRDENDLQNAQRKEFIIKDAINTVLSQKTVDELQRVDTRITLKQELAIVVNSVMGTTAVRNIFFTKYVMQ